MARPPLTPIQRQANALRREVSAHLASLRKAAGLSHNKLAEQVGWSSTRSKYIEQGTWRYLMAPIEYAAAAGYDIPQLGMAAGTLPNLGPNITRLRTEAGLSLHKLAAATGGIDMSTISRLESGYSDNVVLESALILAHALGVTLPELLFGHLTKEAP
jgi:transcriptional regulator with XRE-family HTH domain